jgi:hypothetical protein
MKEARRREIPQQRDRQRMNKARNKQRKRAQQRERKTIKKARKTNKEELNAETLFIPFRCLR